MQQAATEKENYFSAYKLFERTREGRDPDWLAELRGKAGARFEALEFPTTRDEEWKYTSVAPILKVPFRQIFDLEAGAVRHADLDRFVFSEAAGQRLVFVNGLFARGLSDLSELPEGICVTSLGEIPDEYREAARRHLGAYASFEKETFTALNTAVIGDGAFVHIPAGRVVERPIHLLFISSTAEPIAAHPRVLVSAGKGSIASVIESYVSTGESVYFNNVVTEVHAAEGAVLNHYRLQMESEQAFHVATTQIHQERDSNYVSCTIHLGGSIVRHTLNAVLDDEHVETTVDGLYVATGRQHIDNHTSIDHRKPYCNSHQLYKGILDGKSRAIFNGKIFVREGAAKTDAHQLNKNLLLSETATADTKPQLEIFADDVKCSHGATVGQLEDDELFYLASRGINPERARALLTYGFAEDVISKIRLKSVREQLDRVVMDKLHQSLEVA